MFTLFIWIIADFIGRTNIFVLSEPTLSIIKSNDSYYCALNGNSSDSALVWDYQTKAEGSCTNNCFCNIETNTTCKFKGTNNTWQWIDHITHSLILDPRWDDIETKQISSTLPMEVYQTKEDYFNLSFSFKAEEVNVLLCDKECNGSCSGTCYLVVLGGDKGYLRKCKVNETSNAGTMFAQISCNTDLDDISYFPKDQRKNQWKHFTVGKTKNNIAVTVDHLDSVLRYGDENVTAIRYVYVGSAKSKNPSLLKIHKVRTLFTDEITAEGNIEISSGYKSTCLALYVKACSGCILSTTLFNKAGHQTINNTYYIKSDEWQKIVLNKMIKLTEGATISLNCVSPNKDVKPNCYINNVIKECDHTDIPVKVGTKEGCCQALKYPNISVCTKELSEKISSQGQKCAWNEIGRNCVRCKSITGTNCGNSKICDKMSSNVTCSCAPGYTTDNCGKRCAPGTYGHDCALKCGKCVNHCNNVNGECICDVNFSGVSCQTPILPIVKSAPKIKEQGDRNVTLELDLEYEGGNATSYQLQFKQTRDPKWEPVNEKMPYVTSVKMKISELKPNRNYVTRMILYANNGSAYDGDHVPTQQFKTKCISVRFHMLNISVTNASIIITVNQTEDHCPFTQFRLRLYKEEVLRNETSLAESNIFESLEPCTTYNVTLVETATEGYLNISTDQGNPGKVTNISHRQNDTFAEITWDDPSKINCKIMGYRIKYSHVRRRSCRGVLPTKNSRIINVTEKRFIMDLLKPWSVYSVSISAITAYEGDSHTFHLNTEGTRILYNKEFPTVSLPIPGDREEAKFVWDCSNLQGPLKFYVELVCKNHWCTMSSDTKPEVNITEQNLEVKHIFNVIGQTDYRLRMSISRYGNTLSKSINFTTSPTKPNMVRNLTVYTKTNTSISLRWWQPYPPTGHLEYYSITYRQNESKEHTIKVAITSVCKLWRGQICTTIANLNPDQYTNISVRAANIGVSGGLHEWIGVYTREEASEAPRDLTLEWDHDYNLTIQWWHPDRTNGNLLAFLLTINNENIQPYEVRTEKIKYVYKYKIPQHLTARKLTIKIAAKNAVGVSPPAEQTTHSPPKIPKPSEPLCVENAKDTSFSLRIPPILGIDGDISTIYVVVMDKVKFMHYESLEEQGLTEDDIKFWIIDKFDLKNISIGSGFFFEASNNSHSKLNYWWNLKNSTLDMYKVFIVLNNTYEKFSRYKIYTPTCTSLIEEPFGTQLYYLLFVPVIVAFIIYILLKRRHGRIHRHISLPKMRVMDYVTRATRFSRTRNAIPLVPIVNTCEEEWSFTKEVRVSDLYTYTKEAIQNQQFIKQIEILPRGRAKPWIRGTMSENRHKNRFTNLAAYDHSRVKLKIMANDPYSDYVNANYIDGYKTEKAYIATQGPKACTVDDFWRMIWQENVEYVIMLANIVESGKKMLEQYWPEMGCTKRFDTVTVEYTEVETMANYVIRHFDVVYNRKHRHVQQYHFPDWPEGGVPLYFQNLVPLCLKVVSLPQGSSPIVIHSSVGIGRTGSFILCDVCLRMAKAKGKVDVFHHLRKLREQRVNMVDTVEQYILVHLLLIQCLIARKTEIACDKMMKAVIENITTKEVQDEMKYLEDINWQNEAIRGKSPNVDKMIGREKNKFKNVVPDPTHTKYLSSSPTPTNSSPRYSNAVMVDRYLTVSNLIVTQNPVGNAIPDFWQLVDENKITTIVSLTYLNLKDQTVINFYPATNACSVVEPLPYLEVRYTKKEAKKHYDIYWLALRRLDSQERDVPIKLIQINNWNFEKIHPDDPCELLKVYEEMTTLGKASNKILVTCCDGVGASGLFATLCFLIDKIKMEHVCDVCLAVSTTRQSRKEFVREADQYLFLFKCALEYVNQFDVYSNFKN